jgi:hypothetical protein
MPKQRERCLEKELGVFSKSLEKQESNLSRYQKKQFQNKLLWLKKLMLMFLGHHVAKYVPSCDFNNEATWIET